jgi:hypothetical protein
MEKPKGGRGKRADYESTHVRIPDALKERVERLKELFFSGQLDEHEQKITTALQLLDSSQIESSDVSSKSLTLDEALDAARKILKLKRSARESILKLLTALYGVDVTLDDLVGKN